VAARASLTGVHERAGRLLERELERFERDHPRSGTLSRRASASLLAGVPMHWMVRWPGAYPVYASEARGARFRDVDGIEYVDFCLGDTGAMTGHSPEPVVRAVAEQAARGITLMLPSEEALWVGEELGRRFGLPRRQFALTATDACLGPPVTARGDDPRGRVERRRRAASSTSSAPSARSPEATPPRAATLCSTGCSTSTRSTGACS